jgi:hypothetical protein
MDPQHSDKDTLFCKTRYLFGTWIILKIIEHVPVPYGTVPMIPNVKLEAFLSDEEKAAEVSKALLF